MRKLSSQSGMGLIQVAFIATVMIFALLMISKIVDKANFMSGLRGTNARSTLLAEGLQDQLLDAVFCTQALGAQGVDLTIDKLFKIDRLKIGYGNDVGPIQTGWKSTSMGLEISKIEMRITKRAQFAAALGPQNRNLSYDWPGLATVNKNQYEKYYAELFFHFKGERWNPYADDRPVKLALSVDPVTKKIYQCHGVMSTAEVCEAAGGTYDASSNSLPELRCNPDLICFNSSVGLVINKNLCVYPYIATSVGKIGANTNYLCTWCNRNR